MREEEAIRHIASDPTIQHYYLKDNGIFPNSVLPALHYAGVLTLPPHSPRIPEAIFRRWHWTNSWRNGIYDYHHYHSTTHEVLAIYAGSCIVLLGGDGSVKLQLVSGDVVIIPAGVSHKCLSASKDFRCVGAYPNGRDFDINTGKPGERPAVDVRIAKLPIPQYDPVYGKDGPLLEWWK